MTLGPKMINVSHIFNESLPTEPLTMTLTHHRTGVAALVAAMLVAGPAEARTRRKRPPPVNPACAAAYRDAVMLETDGELQAARAKLQTCARSTCGAVQAAVRQPAAARGGRFAHHRPGRQRRRRAVAGRDQRHHGRQAAVARIDGRSLTVDPGVHELTFETAGTPPATIKVVVPQGRRNQPVAAVLHVPDGNAPREEPPRPPPPVVKPPVVAEPPPLARAPLPRREPAPPSTSSVAPTLLTVVGVAGLAGGGVLTYWGRKDNERLTECRPGCPPRPSTTSACSIWGPTSRSWSAGWRWERPRCYG